MRERARHEHLRFLDETRGLLSEVERETRRPVEIRADPRVRHSGRAVYVATDPDPTRHLILYDPQQERHLDHLVAHECGHILRFAAARPEERLVPMVTAERRVVAAHHLHKELLRLVEAGVPEGAIGEMLPVWLGGTVAQLANTPADVHIERRLWDRFPGLRGRQGESLMEQVKTSRLALRPVVAAFTPETVWRASNAMNYVMAETAMLLVGRGQLIRPYWGTPAEETGTALLELLNTAGDTDAVGDRAMSDQWAEVLDVQDWFEWVALDQLPAGARRAWEVGQ